MKIALCHLTTSVLASTNLFSDYVLIVLFDGLQTEMSCCRRIVQLCRDCLLIVYQFAADAKAAGAASVVTQGTTPQESDMRSVTNLFLGPLISV